MVGIRDYINFYRLSFEEKDQEEMTHWLSVIRKSSFSYSTKKKAFKEICTINPDEKKYTICSTVSTIGEQNA